MNQPDMGPRRRGFGPLCAAAALLCAAAVLASEGAAQSAPSLTGIDVLAEGRLARVTIAASGPIERYTLGRQGPPERRDLVLTLLGMVSTLSVPPTDVSGGGDPLVTYEITAREEDGAPALRVLFPRAGDSLVRLENDGGKVSLLLIPPEKPKSVAAEAYRIGPDDVLAISVFGHEDLTKTTKVSPDGVINFPLIGSIRAAGRTVDDLSGEIQERLGKDFLVDPHVTVSVWEYLSQWINVIGEVAKPGRYYMTGPTTLVDAISQAGGLKPAAGESILVTRRPQESNPAEAGEVMHYSAASLFTDEKAASVVRLRPGDVVNVLAREVFYVSGEVRTPGAYPLDRTTTLTKAITLAGGFTGAANTSTLELIREEGGSQQRITVSVRDVEERKTPDPFLRAGDVVVVKRRS